MLGELLQKEIVHNAGAICSLLERNKRMTIEDLCVNTSDVEAAILLSLGWLARENKVVFLEQEGSLAVEMNRQESSLYC